MNLKNRIEEFGLKTDCLEKLEKYRELLLSWNDKMNLTAITEEDEVNIKHFLDSLSLFKTNYFDGSKSVIDIGTGAGFPGIVLKIYNEDLNITLFDSLNKRLLFLNDVIERLKLKDIYTLHGRAEEFGRKDTHRECYDIAVSRAVANLTTLLEYDLPFVKVGGHFIAMKGPEYEEELKNSKTAIEILGGKLKEVIQIKLPSEITHYLIVIEKIKETPKKYPRAGGKPKNNPIR
ncbi:16S rRNA (guanine(527)-N(7))-methyltransferase RsmG [Peptoniphilus mikwangii]|uniref:16S rRNA (guanine(527)-N(7))-methyltransferase RsmG n=1 Tax=Peptoniphilus mikwangii TaxID=1354300 RepID=UPI00041ED725|nr:16S rRNA (guanine(527)-N(7))-methyltransferase RsmG [Peptoniphilus mikwangii]